MGTDLSRMEEGQVQGSRHDPLSRAHYDLGNLSPVWDTLDEETRIVLEQSVAIPEWQEMARICKRCGHTYGPSSSRCHRCQKRYPLTDPFCPWCGDHRSSPEWPRELTEDPTDLGTFREKTLGKLVCPKCDHRRISGGGGAKTAEYREAGTKAKRVARAVTEYRLGKFVADHHVGVLDEGAAVIMRKGLSAGSYLDAFGYCQGCGAWVIDEQLTKHLTTPCCSVRVRWGVRIAEGQVKGLSSAAMGRWAKGLEVKGLVSSSSSLSTSKSAASTAEQ
jgi:ribosomal protein L40E